MEMAFGIIAKKWAILSRPISTRLSNLKFIVKAIAILHNYCNNNDEYAVNQGSDDSYGLACTQNSQIHASADVEYTMKISDEFPQWSMERERLVKRVADMGLERSVRNIQSRLVSINNDD